MKRFLNKLFRDFLTPGKTRRSKPASNRAVLQLNGLEDRMVLSTAFLSGPALSTLNIDVTAGSNIELLELNPTGNRQIVVQEGPSFNQEFFINSIKDVVITVGGNSSVVINDSDGMPFATGTLITLQGSGSNNSLDLNGTRAFDTGELYVVGGTSSTPSSLQEDGLNFQIGNAIGSVTDTIQLTGGPLDVSTSGQNVVLSSPKSGEQTLSGMGPGGGGTFIYADKSAVDLNEFAANATVTLDTAGAGALESHFAVIAHGSGDTVLIAATPSTVSTSVQTLGSGSEVVLEGNSGAVSVTGDSSTNPTTTMIIGQFQGNGDSTKGIQSNVQVNDLKTLILSDSANVSTQENVKVTQSTISGTGLFGNNSAVVSYGGVNQVDINSGQLQDSYTVEASSPTASFTSQIELDNDSKVAFSAHVFLDAKTDLNLSLKNFASKAGELFIDAPGAKFENSSGVVDVTFDGVLSSQIDFQGYTIKEEHA